LALLLGATGGALLALLSSCGQPSHSHYGGLPAWLPKSTIPVGRAVVATVAHPVLGIEGDTVAAELPAGHVLVNVVGPAVPAEGQFPQPPTIPCTFTVTFSNGTGTVPLDASAFTIVDEQGTIRHPLVTAPTSSWPTTVGTQVVTLTVKDVLPTGNGQLRWAPEGVHPIVSWDFDVEID
jgi:hypothetical protein